MLSDLWMSSCILVQEILSKLYQTQPSPQESRRLFQQYIQHTCCCLFTVVCVIVAVCAIVFYLCFCVFGVTIMFFCCRLGQVTLGRQLLNLNEFFTWLNKGYWHTGAHFIKQYNSLFSVMICHSCNLFSLSHLFLLRTAEWEDWGL